MSDSENHDTVRVLFRDGSSTIIYVSYDDNIANAINDMCEDAGYDIQEIVTYSILTD